MKLTFSFIIIHFLALTQPSNDTLFLQNVLNQLTAADLLGRQSGTDGEKMSADFLANELNRIGVEPYQKEYYQPFTFNFVNKTQDSAQTLTLNGVNVVGYINNNKSRTVLLGAHYDHLGINEYGQARVVNSEQTYYPGADDNASGVALLLNLSSWLVENKNELKANYILAFFSAEELGLQGSKYFVQELKNTYKKPYVMLNFDMVGRLNDDRTLIIDGVGSAHSFDSLLSLTNSSFVFDLQQNASGVGSSDYTSFYLDSIPALSFTTGTHSDYHTVLDTKDKINYQGILDVKTFLVSFLSHLEMSEVDFRETEVQQSRRRSDLKVSLGIMPGYGGDEGLKIDAVTKGKTAAIYGLVKGDVIIGINDCNVSSIYDYMDCLKKYKIGDEAILHILRNEKQKKIKVEFK